MLSLAAYGLYVLALVAAAISDLARYEIPNSASVALVAGFALVTITLPLPAALAHLLAAGTVFAFAALLFALGVCGGGDVKLLGATALWMGWSHLPSFLLLMALAGAALALMLLALRRLTASRVVVTTGIRARRLFAKEAGVPYGVAIAIAGLSMLPQLAAALRPPFGLG